jgi:hypothetical protein
MRSVAVFLVAAFVACSGPGEKADTVTSGLTGTPKAGAAGTLDGEAKTESSDESDNELLERARQTFMGDLPDLRERRLVRVLISYSKSNFFHDGARPRGFEVELLRAWEKQLNEGAKTYDRVKVVFVPTPSGWQENPGPRR